MNFNKILLMFIILILTNACKNDNPQVLIGLKILEKNPFTEKIYSSNNDQIIVISQDSIEFIPLWQGCIIAPAYKSKFKFHQGNDNVNYVVTEKDTVEFKIESLGENIYSNTINKMEFRYRSVVNENVKINYNNLLGLFKGKSYQFTLDGKKNIISFHEKKGYILKEKTKKEESINRGRWSIIEAGKYFVLIIDNLDTIQKFQISDISNSKIKIYNLNSDNREETVMSKIQFDSIPFSKGVSESNIEQNPPFAAHYLNLSNSSHEIWFQNNDTFVIYDSSTIYNLNPKLKPTSVYIDWACNAIIAEYDLIFGFEFDKMNNKKINLYPTDKNGKLIRKYSKSYFINNSPNKVQNGNSR